MWTIASEGSARRFREQDLDGLGGDIEIDAPFMEWQRIHKDIY